MSVFLFLYGVVLATFVICNNAKRSSYKALTEGRAWNGAVNLLFSFLTPAFRSTALERGGCFSGKFSGPVYLLALDRRNNATTSGRFGRGAEQEGWIDALATCELR